MTAPDPVTLTAETCKPGMKVKYYPSRGGPAFMGIVSCDPWQLGSGHWVTKLVDMEPGYAEYTGKKGDKATTVYAASLGSIEPAPESSPVTLTAEEKQMEFVLAALFKPSALRPLPAAGKGGEE